MNERLSAPRPRPWSYPVVWMRREQFWEGMFTNSVAGLFVALVIFLGGRSAGLFHQIPWSTVGKTIIAGGAWATALSAAVATFSTVVAWRASSRSAAVAEQARGVLHVVDQISDSLDKHDAKRREWEAELAAQEDQHRRAIDEIMRRRQAAEEDGESDGSEDDGGPHGA